MFRLFYVLRVLSFNFVTKAKNRGNKKDLCFLICCGYYLFA